jgi:PAS domain S-box-containing protein
MARQEASMVASDRFSGERALGLAGSAPSTAGGAEGLEREIRIDAIPDVVLLVEHQSLLILDVNRRGADVFGHPAAQVVGRSLAEFVPGGSPALFARTLQGRHDPHPDVPLRVSFLTPTGHCLPVDIRVGRAFEDDPDSPLVCALRAISESARAAERDIVSIIGAVPAAIVTWSLDGKITSWNASAEKVFGWTGDEATGQGIELIIPAVDLAELRGSFVPVGSDQAPPPREGLRRGRDGEVLVEESLFSVRDVAGRLVRIGAVYRDLSEVARLRRATEAMNRKNRASLAGGPGGGGAMGAVMDAARTAARDPKATILLLGETGVGKSHLARWIHDNSPRASGPFLEVNCAGLDAQLAESELFGHERGAFDGAVGQQRGLVEAADGGPLLLDEIAELPAAVQAKLLNFLDCGQLRRVGGLKRIAADVRIVAATNCDLERAVEEGRFRKDLYFRLRVIPLTLPPLRQRRTELPALAEALLVELCRHRSLAVPPLSPALRGALARYDWPGNFRQLRNALEHALIVMRGEVLSPEDLPLEIRGSAPVDAARSSKLDDVIRRHIHDVLAQVEGNRTRAAQVLGIDRATLRRRLGE